MKIRFILPLFYCCISSLPVSADLADARDALARGDAAAAAREYARLAEAGEAVAQAHLGYMYYTGEGVNRDYGKAVEWFRKAAAQGNADAQYNLAVAYAFGEGVEQDYKQAADWYRKAAEQGHAVARYSLGLSYTYGEGVEQDYEQALRWFESAAGQDYAAAQEAAASLREAMAGASGKPTQTAPETALQTEAKTIPESAGKKSRLLDMEGIEPAPPRPQEQPDDDLLATDTARKAGGEKPAAGADIDPEESSVVPNTRTPSATAEITGTHKTGEKTAGEDDTKESFLKRLFGDDGIESEINTGDTEETTPPTTTETAAAMDDEPQAGTEQPASTDTTGVETPKEEKEGFFDRLFGGAPLSTEDVASPEDGTDEQARTYDPALYEQGMTALENGDYATAVSAFREGANQSDPRAQYRLGSLYYQGLGVPQSYSRAKRWYELSAGEGNADAQYSLGNMYFMGEGVEQNDTHAEYWYEQAADDGHAAARHNLSNLKRIMKSAESPPGIIKGEEQAKESKQQTNAGNDGKKPGFFKRLFGGGEKTAETDDIAAARKAKGPAGETETGPIAGQETADSVPEPVVDAYRKGMAYAFGDGVDKDQEKAFKYFKRSAEAGFAPAQYQLGVAYANGEGTEQDEQQALRWYKQAAVRGHTLAQRNLGLMYMEGRGVEQDKIRALAWYSILAERGNAMDIHRRDTLIRELSPNQITESHFLKSDLQSRITAQR